VFPQADSPINFRGDTLLAPTPPPGGKGKVWWLTEEAKHLPEGVGVDLVNDLFVAVVDSMYPAHKTSDQQRVYELLKGAHNVVLVSMYHADATDEPVRSQFMSDESRTWEFRNVLVVAPFAKNIGDDWFANSQFLEKIAFSGVDSLVAVGRRWLANCKWLTQVDFEGLFRLRTVGNQWMADCPALVLSEDDRPNQIK
jgi:hypothetical protein